MKLKTVKSYMINPVEAEDYKRNEVPKRVQARLDYLFERSDVDPDTITTITELEADE